MPVLPVMPMIDAEGIQKPAGNPAGDFFGFDMDTMFIDLSMRLPTKILEDDGERCIVQDRFGWTARKYKDRSSSMHFLDHVTKTREDWDRLKDRMILDPSDAARLDSESYYIYLNPFPSWKGAEAIYNAFRKRGKYLMFACYGPYECTWRHHGYEASLMDLILEPEWMDEMLGRVTDLTISILEYTISHNMKPDGVLWPKTLEKPDLPCFHHQQRLLQNFIFAKQSKIASFLRFTGKSGL